VRDEFDKSLDSDTQEAKHFKMREQYQHIQNTHHNRNAELSVNERVYTWI
jgi:hypothetical protein